MQILYWILYPYLGSLLRSSIYSVRRGPTPIEQPIAIEFDKDKIPMNESLIDHGEEGEEEEDC